MNCWDSQNRFEMARFINNSGLIQTDDEIRLIKKLEDDQTYPNLSVYDLHEANMLCQRALGWMRYYEAKFKDY